MINRPSYQNSYSASWVIVVKQSKRGLLIVDAKYGKLKPDGRPEQNVDDEFPSWIGTLFLQY